MIGRSVSAASRQVQSGPYSVAHVQTDMGALDFAVLYDSTRAKADYADLTASTCSSNADCGDGRACDSGTCDATDAELPYARVLGPGFRHTYGDRLILDGDDYASPQEIIWESLRRTVTFTQIDTYVWQSEPGTHALLEQSASAPEVWRLLTAWGDVLEFTLPDSPTALHPVVTDPPVDGAATTYSTHLRLTRIYQGAAPNRFIRLLYEGDDVGTGPEEVSSAVCSAMPAFQGQPSGYCYADRGLLVKIGVVLDGDQHGPSIEPYYSAESAPSGAQLRYEYKLRGINSGTDRVDGRSVTELGLVVQSGSHPTSLVYLRDSRYCLSSSSHACKLAYFNYASTPWELTYVQRPLVTTSGSVQIRPIASYTWDTSGNVATHSWDRHTISSSSTPWSSSMAFTVNGTSQTFDLDTNGNVTGCTTGSCGVDGAYATTTDGYTLGRSSAKGVDGVWHAMDYADPSVLTRGPVLVCELVPDQTLVDPPTCTLTGNVATWDAHTTPRSIERRYYDSLGRLRATAKYDVDDALGPNDSVTFPEQADPDTDPNPFAAESEPDAGCDTLTTSFTGGSFDVTSYDYDSDGDGLGGNVNEGSSSTSLFTALPDMLVTRVTRAAQSSDDTTQRSSCVVYERDADSNSNTGRGAITGIRRYGDDGALVAYTDLSNVFPVTSGETYGNDRVSEVIDYRDTTTSPPSESRVDWQACSSDAYDEDDGHPICWEVPQDTGDPISFTETTTATSDTKPYELRRVMTVTGGGTTSTTYTNELAWGPAYERGVGNGVSDSIPEGNFVRFPRDGTSSDATKALAIVGAEHYDSTGTLLWKTVNTRNSGKDPYGRVTNRQVLNGTGLVLRSSRDRNLDTGAAGQDRVSSVDDEVRSSPFSEVTTSYAYLAANDDRLDYVTEADGDVEVNTYGETGNETGRLIEVARGTSVAGASAVQDFTHTQDGLLYENYNSQHSQTTPASTYTYDALRRLIAEDRSSAGQSVEYAYLDTGHVSERIVNDKDGTARADIVTGYDGLGRPVIVEDALTSTTLRLYKWDEKDNSTYESASPPGKSYTLDSAFNRGRLAYVEDRQYGNATFYRYDALGRVISVVQHDGPLSSFSASSLVPIDFTYDNSGTQELVSITYPSGMVATYSYGNDKERPTGVSTSQGSFSLTNATYEPSGAVSGWYWQGSSSNARTITRDLLGRTAEILDKYSGSTWSDVKYYTTYVGDGYDGDGDLVKERDVSSSDTWLSHTTTGNKTRSYVYKDVRDLLSSWVDDGTTETISYAADGTKASDSHGSYSYDSTDWERVAGRTGGSVSASLDYTWDGSTGDVAGLLRSITWTGGMSGTTTFGYGPELETTTVTTSAGTYTSSYDAEKRRVALAYPAGSAVGRFRYAEGRLPLEETLAAGSLAWTGDNVLFGGSPVAQVGTLVNPNYGPTAFHLHTDRMGLVRKISTTSGARLKRYISDAWGASSYSGGDEVIDSAASPNPIWNWRYPGQYVDAGGVYNEGWRDYIPDLGQFTGPDPLAMGTAYQHFGAQAYGYVASSPFRNVDPDGRMDDSKLVMAPSPSGTGWDGPAKDCTHAENQDACMNGGSTGSSTQEEDRAALRREYGSSLGLFGSGAGGGDGAGFGWGDWAGDGDWVLDGDAAAQIVAACRALGPACAAVFGPVIAAIVATLPLVVALAVVGSLGSDSGAPPGTEEGPVPDPSPDPEPETPSNPKPIHPYVTCMARCLAGTRNSKAYCHAFCAQFL